MNLSDHFFAPDFSAACRICDTSPCVVVVTHSNRDTDLCGICFFADRSMLDWNLWNDFDETDQNEKETQDD